MNLMRSWHQQKENCIPFTLYVIMLYSFTSTKCVSSSETETVSYTKNQHYEKM